MIRHGDTVRVTSKEYQDSAIEGQVLQNWRVSGYNEIKVEYLGQTLTLSSRVYDFEVLRAVEPVEVGSVIENYVKWTNEPEYSNRWIDSATGMWANWQHVAKHTGD